MPAEDAEPGVLHDLVGDGGRPDERESEPAHAGRVRGDEIHERALVAGAESGDER